MERTEGSRQRSAVAPEPALIVHDYLNQYGGAERVLEAIHAMYPNAPVYTSIHDATQMPESYANWDIRQSWLDRIPGISGHHQYALPLFPAAFRRVDVNPGDLVVSTSSAWAKGIRIPPGAMHVSYVHSPMRFAWSFDQYCEREHVPAIAEKMLPPAMAALRWRDRVSAQRITTIVANSTAVRDRIRAYWRRDAQIVFPPVETDGFVPAPASEIRDEFLVISRLVPYKRLDLIIEAFNRLGLRLNVVGEGRARRSLESIASPNIRFYGWLPDDAVRHLAARSRAMVFMSEDDFGIAQVESQAAGRPVIALARGGVLDSVVPDETGVWVADQTVESLVAAIQRFDALRFDPDRIVRHARRFSVERFQREFADIVARTTSTASSE